MSLSELCAQITVGEHVRLPDSHAIGRRLVCPEYSTSVQEVKTYPLLEHDRLFALCWSIDGNHTLNAALKPSPAPFCYSRKFLSGEKTQLHTHDYIELSYVVEGEFRQKILGKDIVFQKGELCLIDKNCLHQDYLLNSKTVTLFLGLANDMFDEIMDENITPRKIVSFLQSALMKQKGLQQYLHFKPSGYASRELEDCLHTVLLELIRSDAGSRHICKGLMIRVFRLLSTEYEFSLSREQRRTMNWVVFEEISEYIKEHSSTVRVQDLVKTFHFQEDYFNRLIKGRTGLTYSEYVQQIRLTKAEQLLRSSGKSVEEIAEAVGYHNKGYFYKIFQEKYGMTPKQFRQRPEGSLTRLAHEPP